MISCKFAFVLLAVVSAVLSAPADEPVPIVNQESDIQPDGTFKWSFETGDGTKQEQSGQPKQISQDQLCTSESMWKKYKSADLKLPLSKELQGTPRTKINIEQETPIVLQGSASWKDNEGNTHELTYVADENGYQPQSADIPQAPEVPAAIAKSLEYNAAHPEQDEEPKQQ